LSLKTNVQYRLIHPACSSADESVARGFKWDFPWHVAMRWINAAKQSHACYCLGLINSSLNVS